MSRRIDIELTSSRDDGTWTWRAAGAKQPKGTLDADLLYPGAKTGDIVRAEAEFEIEGITIITVMPPKEKRSEPERLEIIGPRPERERDKERADAAPPKPKEKRLTPGNAYRTAVVESLSPEQRPVAEQVLRGGVPAVRTALALENEKARAEGRPEVRPEGLITM